MKKYRWDALIERVPEQCDVVEVGVWRGQMSARMLAEHLGMHLVMVDIWEPFPPGHSYYDGSIKIARMSEEELETAYQEALQRVKPYEGRYQVMRMESAEAAKQFDDGVFDLVFLDDDHSKQGVLRSCEAWVSKVKPGGYIGGHDYGHPNQGDVKGAVEEFFKDRLDDLELDVNRTWWIKL